MVSQNTFAVIMNQNSWPIYLRKRLADIGIKTALISRLTVLGSARSSSYRKPLRNFAKYQLAKFVFYQQREGIEFRFSYRRDSL